MSNDVTIPASPEAEEALLGSLLIDPDQILEVSGNLLPGDFYREKNGWIYREMLGLYERGEPIDFVMLSNALESRKILTECGGAAYLSSLLNAVPSAIYASHYGGIVKSLSVRRQLIATASHLAQLAYDPAQDVREIQTTIMAELTGYEVGKVEDEPEHIGKPVDALLNTVQHGGLPAIKTGYKSLDKILKGGVHLGQLIILAGRPGTGKTALGLNIAYHMAKNRAAATGYFSLEMSKQELAGRFMSLAGDVPNDIFNDPEIAAQLTDADWTGLLTVAGEVAACEIILDDTAGIYLSEFYAKVRKMKAQHDVKVVFIDYLQLIRVSDKEFHSRSLEVGFITASLKRMARQLKICIVAMSQMSRAIEGRTDGRPQLSDLRESGAIEQDADVVAFLYREDKVKPMSTRKGIVDVIFEKVRNGATDEAPLFYRGEFIQFNEIQVQGAVPVFNPAPPTERAITAEIAELTGGDVWTQDEAFAGEED